MAKPTFSDAIRKLHMALADLKARGVFKRIEDKKKAVLDEFQSVFALQAINDLSGETFRAFLKPSKNQHWSGLSRSAYAAADESKMPTLRKALEILLNEDAGPISNRLDGMQLKNVGKAVSTAILQVAYPNLYGVWNKRSEQGLKRLGLWPKFEKGMSFGERYKIINDLLLALAKSVGEIDLWTLDLLWFHISDFVADAASDAAEIAQERADGFSSDPRIRKLVEERAMAVAQQHYAKEGYEVDPSKHENCPYDMECTKGGVTLHVEVKGTQGTGKKIILTKNELRHAEEYQPMELIVVSQINIATSPATGGEKMIYTNWNPKTYASECIAVQCTLLK